MHSKFYKMKFQRLSSKACEKVALDESSNDEVFEDENLNRQGALLDTEFLTIEGLRRTYNSCSNCGVCWYDDHVSLDCRECGGYAMRRPCPMCNGQCGNTWRRDVKASHLHKHAEWHGTCSQWQAQESDVDSNANFHDAFRCLQQTHKQHLL